MAHRPHLLVHGPWTARVLSLSDEQTSHLRRVLRIPSGAPLDYTDGSGTVGSGRLVDGGLERGDEHRRPGPPPSLTVAVAPPGSRDRLRFLVEKLSELGVARIRWLRTRHGEGRLPRVDRAVAWAAAALEQSRGAWLTGVDQAWCEWSDLALPVVAADPGGDPVEPDSVATFAVGPEGGWASDEIPDDVRRASLGDRVLRVETAALVGAARLLR